MDASATDHGLDAVEIFADLDPAERSKLAAELATLSLRRGEVLVGQRESADALFVVVTGRFAVTVDGRQIAEVGPGQPIGEVAFLAGGARTATVTALRDSAVLKLGRSQFEALAARNPQILRTLNVTLARRLAEGNVRRADVADPRPRTIAIIGAGGGTVPPVFIEALVEVFASRHATILLRGETVAGFLSSGSGLDSAEATRDINTLEARYDYVVFLADDEVTPWTEKAIRQSDVVLRVGRHDSDPRPNALEALAAELLPAGDQRLVLLHDTRAPISGTKRWLRGRDVAMHHHVALDTIGDVERLYRFVNGTALGFVACGGGAYCVSHIGLYQALTEAGMVFDIVGGTSGGGAMTAAFAIGEPPAEVHRRTNEIFVTHKGMARYTWPVYSLLDHTHFDRLLLEHYGTGLIEDLWIPFFAVSTNLSSYELHVHRTGSIFAAVRATGSIPVLFPPFYTEDGHMLVDGALTDNVPVRTMHELKTGPNVVATFSVPRLETFDVNYAQLPGRNALLQRLATPFLRRRRLPAAPGLATVLMRSMMANPHVFEQHLRPDDLVLTAPLPEGMGILDWHRNAEVVDGSYHWARAEAARLRSAGHPVFG